MSVMILFLPKVCVATLLRPTGARTGRRGGQQLPGYFPSGRAHYATPLLRHHEQGRSVDPAQHTGEAAAVEVDRVQHLAAFTNTHAPLVRDVRVPDGAFGVEANAVGDAATEVGPHPLAG